jgi:hypothetical protein
VGASPMRFSDLLLGKREKKTHEACTRKKGTWQSPFSYNINRLSPAKAIAEFSTLSYKFTPAFLT